MLKRELAAQLDELRHVVSQLRADNARLMRENNVLRGDVNKLTHPHHPSLSAYEQACAVVNQL